MDSGTGEGSSSRFSANDDYESLSSTTEADLLKRAWRTEKAAPEILQFEANLVQRSREQIQLVEEIVEELMTSGSDPLIVSLNQMDLDRTLFLLRSYLRTRLQKIEKYMVHIHKNAELWNRLSQQEQKFAKKCIEDLEEHFEKSVLSKLPDRYKSSLKQSVISEEDDMVPEPQLDTYVICRTTRSLGALQLDDRQLLKFFQDCVAGFLSQGDLELVQAVGSLWSCSLGSLLYFVLFFTVCSE